MNNIPQKILIIGPTWVGDMVMTQCLFKILKQRYPNVILDVLAPSWSFQLLDRMPEINHSWEMSIGRGELALITRYRIAKQIATENYDQAIVIPNSFKSALIPWWANIPIRTGWRGECRWGLLNDMRSLDRSALPLMVQRLAALGFDRDTNLADKLPRPKLISDPKLTITALNKFNLNTSQPILALCPGAEFGTSKQWPQKYYASVARHKLQAGWSVWIFGSAKDRTIAENIQKLSHPNCHNLAGKTSLAEAIDLLSLATTVISNDSGLMHIAAALQKPLLVIYGSTSPDFTPPLTTQVKIIRNKLDCSPCFKRECPLEHLNCLRQLEPAQVIQALDQLNPCTS